MQQDVRVSRPPLEQRLRKTKSWMFPALPSLPELARGVPERVADESGLVTRMGEDEPGQLADGVELY